MHLVSAVIPTVGRASLPASIASARQQVGHDVEVVVVFDTPEDAALLPLAEDADRILFTGGIGGGGARNAGVSAATGDWIGFLDDDDQWLPTKTAIQLAAAETTGADVVASRVQQTFVDATEQADMVPVPLAVYEDGAVADYLFRKRRAGNGRASLYTSCLLVRREIAVCVQWDETLRRHQDWDWIVRAVDAHGALLVQVPEVTVTIATGTEGSISRGVDWRSSLAWASRVLRPQSAATFADFVAAQPLRYALTAKSLPGAWACARAVAASGRAPSPSTLVVGLAGALPRGVFSALYRVVR